ncbi:MAG TPA: PKD domain-containing protein, partial [Candidatus Thermoplasmatota archaeon]|nr:PKD domain-containing protein [Candidatus Thermoplasmatota archaeon]
IQAGDSWTATATGRDDHGGEATQSRTVEVGNRAPAITSLSISPTGPKRGDSLVASVQGSDPDGQAVSYSWTWYDDDVLQSGLTTANGPQAPLAKGHTWKVVAMPTDGRSDGPSQTATVGIQNTAPTASGASATPSQATTGQSVVLRAVAQDADGDPLTATWTLPNGQTLSGLETTTSFPTAGTYTIPVTASDGQATSNSKSVTITVTAPSGGSGDDDSGGSPGGGNGDTGGDTGGGNTGDSGSIGGGSDGSTGGDSGGSAGGNDGSGSTGSGESGGDGDSGSADSTGNADNDAGTGNDSNSESQGDQATDDASTEDQDLEGSEDEADSDEAVTDQDGEWTDDLGGQADVGLHSDGEKVSWWNEQHDVPAPGLVLLLAAFGLTALAARRRIRD